MHHEEFISRLAVELGLRDLAFNEENVCRLIVDNQTVIDIEYESAADQVHLCCPVAAGSDWSKETCREMLAANLWGRGTGGGSLALDDDQGELMLLRSYELQAVTFPEFLEQLNRFVNAAADWALRLADAEPDTPTGPTETLLIDENAMRV